MPIDDILREQADTEAMAQERLRSQMMQGGQAPTQGQQQQAQPQARQSMSGIQIGRNDLQVLMQGAELVLLLLILTRL